MCHHLEASVAAAVPVAIVTIIINVVMKILLIVRRCHCTISTSVIDCETYE